MSVDHRASVSKPGPGVCGALGTAAPHTFGMGPPPPAGLPGRSIPSRGGKPVLTGRSLDVPYDK